MDNTIQTEPKPACIVCGQPGDVLYGDLEDRLFGVPGTWTLKKCTNTECNLVWLDPAPRKDEIWKAYTTYYTHRDNQTLSSNVIMKGYRFVRDCYYSLAFGYFEGLIQSRTKWLGLLMYLFPGKRADVDFSIMYLPAKPQGRLLEIGCGSGSMLSYMRSLGWQSEGIDVDPSAVSNARSKGLKVALGPIEDQGYSENSFDAIMISHVIEHVPDPQTLLSECHRILKPGGVLSLVTPNVGSAGRKRFGRAWLALDPPRHLILYNGRTIESLARKAGFADIKTRTTIRDAHSLFWASYSIARNGTFTMGSQPQRGMKLTMHLLRLIEWALIKVSPHSGEEISLIGTKR